VNPARWKSMKEIFASAVELEPDARPAFLRNACGSDQTLLAELEALIESHQANMSLPRGNAASRRVHRRSKQFALNWLCCRRKLVRPELDNLRANYLRIVEHFWETKDRPWLNLERS